MRTSEGAGRAPAEEPGSMLKVELVFDPGTGTADVTAHRMFGFLFGDLAQVDGVTLRRAPAAAPPEGAKGTDAPGTFALLATLGASGGVLTALVGTVNRWLALNRATRPTISLTIDGDPLRIEGASDAQAQELIDLYVRRHSPPTVPDPAPTAPAPRG